MAKYVLAFRGGEMAPTEEERQAVMAAWGAWFGELGAAVVEPGAPFSTSASLSAADAAPTDGGASGLTGYTVISADSMAAATDLSRGCPIFASGGSIDVYQAIEM